MTEKRQRWQGVDFHKARGKWRARIKGGGAIIHLGFFATEGEAGAARMAAELVLPAIMKLEIENELGNVRGF